VAIWLTSGGGACGSGLGFAPHHEGLAALVTFFAEGDRLVKGGWWISICHPVLAASREDIVASEYRAIGRRWRRSISLL
jgi:hypothetical protein